MVANMNDQYNISHGYYAFKEKNVKLVGRYIYVYKLIPETRTFLHFLQSHNNIVSYHCIVCGLLLF